ncbi:MAG: transcriptional regulator [Azorhizobium sp. 12-66-6]|nr:MAG: transcriptional regulator [Azorhizobium sp. 12-66-6]
MTLDDNQNGSLYPALADLSTEIICAYVSNNSVAASALPALIADVHAALVRLAGGDAEPVVEPQKSAVPVKKSVTPDFIICLEDGLKFKSLKRHLRTKYDLTPEEYRAKWGLPADYPMVAPNYAAARSELAKQMGLGQQRAKAAAAAAPAKKAPAKRRAAAAS